MTLSELTTRENEWLDRHPSRGFMEEKDALCKEEGIYDVWREIFAEYVALAGPGDLEALKRALFLAWYEMAEPSHLSGLYLLDAEAKKEVFQMLEDFARQDQLDEELKWMLPYYYSIADWYLKSEFEAVRKASERNVKLWRTGCLNASFENRGQLGRYWTSIQDGQKRERSKLPFLRLESRIGRTIIAARVAWRDFVHRWRHSHRVPGERPNERH